MRTRLKWAACKVLLDQAQRVSLDYRDAHGGVRRLPYVHGARTDLELRILGRLSEDSAAAP
jgi:uncharacterized phage protein gp47/JayE